MRWGELLNGLWAASLSGAVIILAVLLLRAAFQDRTPRRLFGLLWDAALARLLVLTALPSPVSVWQWLPASAAARGTGPNRAAVPGLTVPAVGAVIGDGTAVPGLVTPTAPPDTDTVLAAVWLTVGLALAVWFLWGHLRFRRSCADSLPCTDPFVRGWLAAHPLRRPVQARTSDRVAAPLTYGVLRPVVLLPAGMDWADRTALRFVLEHEYQHIRRFDVLRKALLAAAACLHWFNPLVWVLYVLSSRDMELACDEAVTARGPDRAGYARILLNLEERRGHWGLSGSHFSQNALEERIRCIMKHKKTSVTALIAVVAVMSITVAAFASKPPESKTDPPQDTSTPGFYRDSAVGVMLSRGGEDGETRYSVDEGKTWMSAERYHAQYGPWGDDWQVEWWTSEEEDAAAPEAVDEAALLEELKKYGISGEKGDLVTSHGILIRYLVDGVALQDGGYAIRYVYANPDGEVDVHTLRSAVRNPDGSYDPMGELTGTVASDDERFDQGLIDSAIGAGGLQAEAGADQENDTGAQLEPYKAFGLSYENKPDQNGEMQLRMSWNGKPVHSLWDTETGTWFANNMHGSELGEGAVDLETVYRDGKLCGLRESQPPHEVVHGVEAATASGSGAQGGRPFEEVFARYQPYGLVYSPREGRMGSLTWNGQAVRSFADLKPDGGAFSYEDPYAETGLRVRAEYDAAGQLTGLCEEKDG